MPTPLIKKGRERPLLHGETIMFRQISIAAAVAAAFISAASACTTIVVDKDATVDNGYLIARSVDGHQNASQWVVNHTAKKNQKGMYRNKDLDPEGTNFEYPLPETALAFSSTPSWIAGIKNPEMFNDGASGFNELGVGLSGTESIYASDKALSFDPYTDAGIGEVDITNVILPRAHTAREGVKILGSIIEKHGACEGFGVAFVDKDELWYLETGTAHQWIARRIPKSQYLATGNQGRLQEYDPNSDDFMASPNLVQFAVDHGLYNPKKDGAFNFAKAYTRDDDRDRTYNDPRVWVIQKSFNPSMKQKIDDGRNFPVFVEPERKLTLDDVKTAMRNHYEGESFDPYTNGLKPDSANRPISVFRAYQTHILQVRPQLPKAIGEIRYLSLGMADLSVFVPFYQGLTTIPASYQTGTKDADNNSSFWKIRKLQGVVMTDYPNLAPMVQKAYKDFEAKMAKDQAGMEAQYLKLVKKDPKAAQKLLNTFNVRVLREADELTDRLFNEVMTVQINNMQQYIPFNNRKHFD